MNVSCALLSQYELAVPTKVCPQSFSGCLFLGHIVWFINFQWTWHERILMRKSKKWPSLSNSTNYGYREWDDWISIAESMDMSLSKLRDSEGQGSRVCCSAWGRRVSHNWVTEQQVATQTKPDLELICILSLLLEFLLKYEVQAGKNSRNGTLICYFLLLSVPNTIKFQGKSSLQLASRPDC